MRYMLLLFADEAALEHVDNQAEMQRHFHFYELMAERGIALPDGQALYPTANARTLRPQGESVVVSDGPFAELKDQIGGYYILDADDIDAALDAAKACPMYSAIEIRPVWEIPQ